MAYGESNDYVTDDVTIKGQVVTPIRLKPNEYLENSWDAIYQQSL